MSRILSGRSGNLTGEDRRNDGSMLRHGLRRRRCSSEWPALKAGAGSNRDKADPDRPDCVGAYKEWLTCGKRPADEGGAYMSETCERVVWACTRAADRLSPCSAFRPPKVAMPLHGASVLAGRWRLPTQPPLARPVAPVPDTVSRSNKWMLSALSPMQNVVPRNRSIERCHPFV